MKLPGQLSRLDEEQHSVMVDLLSLGKTDTEIVDVLQKDKGWLTDVKRDTLARSVAKWRKGTGQKAVIQQVTALMTTQTGKMRKQVDVVFEMSEMIETQKKRLAVIMKQEAGKPLLLNTVSEEMKTLYAMLDRLGRLQMDVGILRKVRVGETAEQYEIPEAEYEEVEESFTEEDRRILAAITGEDSDG